MKNTVGQSADASPSEEDAPARYIAIFSSELFDSAAEAVASVNGLSNLDSISICQARPIGRVENRAVMIPL